ncbi:MAG: PAS domain S-box protein [Chloroflexota bacterium]
MTGRQSSTKKTAALRKQAEKRLREWGTAGKSIPKNNVLELIHELEVHQIELEMQNEELRRSQAELEAARKKYVDLYDLAPVGYVSLDRAGCIRGINLTGADMLGRTRRYINGLRFTSFVEPGRQDDFNRFCRQLLESGKREELEIQLQPAKSPPLVALLSGVVIRDAEGNSHLFQVAMTDITARVAAQRWRRQLIETTQDALIAIDSRAQITVFNGAAERIFGYAAAETIGKKVNMLMAEPYRREHDQYIARYERTGEKRVIGKIREVTARRKNGEIFPIELSVTELGENDEPRYAAFIRDVSEKAKLQADLIGRTRLATIGETSAQVAHEIANPINGIAMGIELLDRQLPDTTDPGVRATLNRIEREVDRLKHLLFDFRDLSREPKYTRRPLSLSAVVEDLCGIHEPVYESHGIKIEVEMEPGLPLVYADEERIKQVLLNLCKNAEEAMPDGGTLTIRGYRSEGNVILEIRDTGCGIPADMDIFRPFKSDKDEGSGLGLVIARQIVTAHAGTLTYRSTVGTGTSFFLSLPAAETAGEDK